MPLRGIVILVQYKCSRVPSSPVVELIERTSCRAKKKQCLQSISKSINEFSKFKKLLIIFLIIFQLNFNLL